MGKVALFVCAAMFTLNCSADSFSCNIGTRPACLGYSDKVVDSSAQCFDSLTCGYKGFVCKSKFDDLVDEYDKLVNQYNDGVRRNKDLINSSQSVINRNNELVRDYNELLERAKRIQDDLDDKTREAEFLANQVRQLLTAQRKKPP